MDKPQKNQWQNYFSQIGIEGILFTVSPIAMMLPFQQNLNALSLFGFIIAFFSSAFCALAAYYLLRVPNLGKFFMLLSMIAGIYVASPHIISNPYIALITSLLTIGSISFFWDYNGKFFHRTEKSASLRKYYRTWASQVAMLFILIGCYNIFQFQNSLQLIPVFLSYTIGIFLYLQWNQCKPKKWITILTFSTWVISSILLWQQLTSSFLFLILIHNIFNILNLYRKFFHKSVPAEFFESFWHHPGRVLVLTFLGLCFLGTIILSSHLVAKNEVGLSIIDAAFTAVSAACVTGLGVIDISKDLNLIGQLAILMLIQLGGLGIMGITTLMIHSISRRISISQERLMTSMTQTDRKDLIGILQSILIYTFSIEALGALFLTYSFWSVGFSPLEAIYRGIFTSISAFCNAGFALQSDSLVLFAGSPFTLSIVSLLIICGGLAPFVTLSIPNYLRKKPVDINVKLVLFTSVILLFSGTIFFMIFEWDNSLHGLSLINKISNSWFQSTTLRTAGFNSVDLTNLSDPSLLFMNIYMFIGGSPGGTAGGIKTTTIAILFLTFWTQITNKRHITFKNRRISMETMTLAITITFAGVLAWTVFLLMLLVTQDISPKSIIFETTSALATVGLTIGATGALDSVGKFVVMLAMFSGRVGPVTLFALLSSDRMKDDKTFINSKINLS